MGAQRSSQSFIDTVREDHILSCNKNIFTSRFVIWNCEINMDMRSPLDLGEHCRVIWIVSTFFVVLLKKYIFL